MKPFAMFYKIQLLDPCLFCEDVDSLGYQAGCQGGGLNATAADTLEVIASGCQWLL